MRQCNNALAICIQSVIQLMIIHLGALAWWMTGVPVSPVRLAGMNLINALLLRHGMLYRQLRHIREHLGILSRELVFMLETGIILKKKKEEDWYYYFKDDGYKGPVYEPKEE